MSPIHTDRRGVALTGEEAFLEIVLSDEELLRAEFDALVAAEWTTPRPRAAASGKRKRERRPVGAQPSAAPETAYPSRPGNQPRLSERSPPRKTTTPRHIQEVFG